MLRLLAIVIVGPWAAMLAVAAGLAGWFLLYKLTLMILNHIA